ncbi:hypothetical protein GR927_23040 [Mycolicibacterium sp. 3033]|nr:hypothetical protein [Mycolicibacterium aurantiacum]
MSDPVATLDEVESFAVSRADVLDRVSAIDAGRYARTRNFTDGGTQISPYLTRGLVTLPEVRDMVLERFTRSQAYKFVFELAWREYWQREWTFLGDRIFGDVKHPQHPVSSRRMPRAVLDAEIGVAALDAAVRGLYDTGYMHNHERMWLAGLTCNIGRTHWWEPARWLYYHLLDGDPASNSLSWQWVAGTNSHKKYMPAQQNINKYSQMRQHGTIIDHGYGALAEMAVPDVLIERADLDLSWSAPPSDAVVIDPAKPTLLYHSFWLNAAWRGDVDANRIVLMEPSWFARFPVSPKVTGYLLRCAREIPGAQVVVAEFDDLDLGDDVTFMRHPSVPHWRGTADEMPQMFPNVPEKSYASFTSFWKQCERTTR